MNFSHSPRRRFAFTFFLLFNLTLISFSPGVAARAGWQKKTKRAAAATASTPPTPAPTAAPRQPAQLINRVLANGLEVIVLADHAVPLVTVELAVKNGSYTEPPEFNGLSHLYEHMFFKANRATVNQEEYLKTAGQLGITYNAQTNTELVNYYYTTTSPNLRTTLNLMRDAARYPLFDEGQLAQEREVVIGEIDRNESNPYFYLNREMMDRLFYKYPSRKNPLGNRQTVSGATSEMMRTIQQRYYVPNNSALVVTGDVQPEEVFRLAQEFYGDWPRADEPFVKYPLVEHPPLAKSEAVVIKQNIQNVIIEIGWHGPSIGADNPGSYAADVFSFILQQPNSRFQRALVDSGLVTGVSISYLTQRNVGPITIIAQTTPEKARAAVRAIYNEVGHFNDPDYFSDEQLESAKGLLEAEDLYSREKLSEYVHSISFWWASTGIEYFRGYLGNLRQTSRADISRYATNYIQGKPHVAVALMSPASAETSKLTEVELKGE
ncbi:MAG TPA: pitrilysin family protein [Pyrinomonadaceae bacterium]|nr:pitrilysin family protein [Pyrinomonadaceae bacterium]